jgi:uncharacterized protein
MKVAVTGASGFVGAAAVAQFRSQGWQVVRLVRRSPRTGADECAWDPERGFVDVSALSGVQAILHLAGENIASGRWTAARKERIRRSRVEGTRLIARTAAALQPRPQVLVSASAVGIYGDRGEEVLTEESAPGEGFLADVARAWEDATAEAEQAGIRVVHARFGLVLDPAGGALVKMTPLFRFALGGRVGDGKQYWSWITREDAVQSLACLLQHSPIRGPVNVVSPEPATNAAFTRALAQAVRRPAWLPLPAMAARLVLGEMAEATLLASTRVLPVRLEEAGFRFRDVSLEDALLRLLRR